MNKILKFASLHFDEEDKESVIQNVTSNTSFRGANLWILVCAILIASIGLNVNSTAVIIGAMLISPLMGPIIGAGFGLSTYNTDLIFKSTKNLIIATIVSLFVSTLYFYISPFKETQSELLSRTSPNIYDVLIAFFGGTVGAISITRKQKGNPIPGVAIATALMPPLCTAGYSLSIMNFRYFFGALFLYFINCVFICISTFLIVKFLKYPRFKNVNIELERIVKYGIPIVIIIIIVPALFFAVELFSEKKFIQNAETFIFKELTSKKITLVYKQIDVNTRPKLIKIGLLNQVIDKNQIDKLKSKMSFYGLKNTLLEVIQDTININELIRNEMSKENSKLDSKEIMINQLRNELSIYKFDNSEIINEIKALFPEISDITIGRLSADSVDTVPLILIYSSNKNLTKDNLISLESWLRIKFKTESIYIFKNNK